MKTLLGKRGHATLDRPIRLPSLPEGQPHSLRIVAFDGELVATDDDFLTFRADDVVAHPDDAPPGTPRRGLALLAPFGGAVTLHIRRDQLQAFAESTPAALYDPVRLAMFQHILGVCHDSYEQFLALRLPTGPIEAGRALDTLSAQINCNHNRLLHLENLCRMLIDSTFDPRSLADESTATDPRPWVEDEKRGRKLPAKAPAKSSP